MVAVALQCTEGVNMMVGEDERTGEASPVQGHAVRVPAGAAEATEDDLSRRGLCNWLIDWSPATGEHVYCGRPASGVLCSEHRGTFGVPIGEGLV